MLAIAALTAITDQYFKSLASKRIEEGHMKELIKDKLYAANYKNPGLAMGVLSDNRKALLGISAASLISIGYMVKDAHDKKRGPLHKIALGLILGGGVSNVYDRFSKGSVTDYIYVKKNPAPVFNLADAAVLLGSMVILIKGLLNLGKK